MKKETAMKKKPTAALMFFAVLTVQAGTGFSVSQDVLASRLQAQLEPEIKAIMTAGKIPSAAVALIKNNRVVWTAGFGYSNVWAKTPAGPNTVYCIGSIYKTISTYALLQQMDEGKFGLDDPVNGTLTEFKIQREKPSRPVTFRHLLTHTSGLPTDFGPRPIWGESAPQALVDYLSKSLQLQYQPLTRVNYSNIAYTLIAYLVEKFSGVPYKTYIREHFFKPLDMRDMEFEPRPDMVERLAIPYMFNWLTRKFSPVELKNADVWPAGIVYGTVRDLANWLIANLNGGEFRGSRFIKEETFRQMMSRQYDQLDCQLLGGWLNETTGYGLTWSISQRNGETLFAHSGSINGYTGFIVGDLQRKTGFIVLTNGHRVHRHLYKLALKALDSLNDIP